MGAPGSRLSVGRPTVESVQRRAWRSSDGSVLQAVPLPPTRLLLAPVPAAAMRFPAHPVPLLLEPALLAAAAVWISSLDRVPSVALQPSQFLCRPRLLRR